MNCLLLVGTNVVQLLISKRTFDLILTFFFQLNFGLDDIEFVFFWILKTFDFDNFHIEFRVGQVLNQV
jgi:hypothetical protein